MGCLPSTNISKEVMNSSSEDSRVSKSRPKDVMCYFKAENKIFRVTLTKELKNKQYSDYICNRNTSFHED